MKKKVTLACSVCDSRNYATSADGVDKHVRLEMKKYCRHCNTHVLHRETK